MPPFLPKTSSPLPSPSAPYFDTAAALATLTSVTGDVSSQNAALKEQVRTLIAELNTQQRLRNDLQDQLRTTETRTLFPSSPSGPDRVIMADGRAREFMDGVGILREEFEKLKELKNGDLDGGEAWEEFERVMGEYVGDDEGREGNLAWVARDGMGALREDITSLRKEVVLWRNRGGLDARRVSRLEWVAERIRKSCNGDEGTGVEVVTREIVQEGLKSLRDLLRYGRDESGETDDASDSDKSVAETKKDRSLEVHELLHEFKEAILDLEDKIRCKKKANETTAARNDALADLAEDRELGKIAELEEELDIARQQAELCRFEAEAAGRALKARAVRSGGVAENGIEGGLSDEEVGALIDIADTNLETARTLGKLLKYRQRHKKQHRNKGTVSSGDDDMEYEDEDGENPDSNNSSSESFRSHSDDNFDSREDDTIQGVRNRIIRLQRERDAHFEVHGEDDEESSEQLEVYRILLQDIEAGEKIADWVRRFGSIARKQHSEILGLRSMVKSLKQKLGLLNGGFDSPDDNERHSSETSNGDDGDASDFPDSGHPLPDSLEGIQKKIDDVNEQIGDIDRARKLEILSNMYSTRKAGRLIVDMAFQEAMKLFQHKDEIRALCDRLPEYREVEAAELAADRELRGRERVATHTDDEGLNREAKQHIEDLRTEIRDRHQDVNYPISSNNTYKEEIERLVRRHRYAGQLEEDWQDEKYRLTLQIANLDDRIDDVQNQNDILEHQIDDLMESNADYQQGNARLTKLLQKAEQKETDSQNATDKLKATINRMKNTTQIKEGGRAPSPEQSPTSTDSERHGDSSRTVAKKLEANDVLGPVNAENHFSSEAGDEALSRGTRDENKSISDGGHDQEELEFFRDYVPELEVENGDLHRRLHQQNEELNARINGERDEENWPVDYIEMLKNQIQGLEKVLERCRGETWQELRARVGQAAKESQNDRTPSKRSRRRRPDPALQQQHDWTTGGYHGPRFQPPSRRRRGLPEGLSAEDLIDIGIPDVDGEDDGLPTPPSIKKRREQLPKSPGKSGRPAMENPVEKSTSKRKSRDNEGEDDHKSSSDSSSESPNDSRNKKPAGKPTAIMSLPGVSNKKRKTK